jgi:hypothetical protein
LFIYVFCSLGYQGSKHFSWSGWYL